MMEASNLIYFLCADVFLFSFCVCLLVVISGAIKSIRENVRDVMNSVKNGETWAEELELQDKEFGKYDRFLKWNSMLDTSYRTNGMVCAFRYKGERRIEFCRYNPGHSRLPLEVYDCHGLGGINERMFDAWLPCIGGVAPVGENTIPQWDADETPDSSTGDSEDGWIDAPSHDSSPAG